MNEELERQIARLLEEEDLVGAATAAIQGYGPAVLRFLMTRTRDETRAAEAFAQMAEDLWRGLAGFRGGSAFSTWMFALARNAAHREARRPHNRPSRHETVSPLAGVAAEVRHRTAPYLQTEIKDRFRAIRESLDEDERTLLYLRVDQDMPWEDVARVMADGALDDESLRRSSARLRKRFDRLRQKLRTLAEAEGLLEPRS